MCFSRFERASVGLLCVWLLSGCESLGYYTQSVQGHLTLLAGARDIDGLVIDPGTSPQLVERLQPVAGIVEFAHRELDLPDNGSYRRYVDVMGEAVVWSVVATPAFDLTPQQWCYPVIGCAAYRGYFQHAGAMAKAAELAAQGLDVAVLPVPAYSTLGWLADPLPSTVVKWPEYRLAGLIFHELAHQRLYVADDSAFNESYASLIEEEGTRRWLAQQGDASAVAQWRAAAAREADFLALIESLRGALAQLYQGNADESAMAAGKQRRFAELRRNYQTLRMAWGGYGGYDAWMARDLNNAHLTSLDTYQRWLPALRALLQVHAGDIAAFNHACDELAELSPEQRTQRLGALR